MSEAETLRGAIERLEAWAAQPHAVPQVAEDVGIVLNAARDYVEALRVVAEVRRGVDGPVVVAVRTPATPDEYSVTLLPDEKFDRHQACGTCGSTTFHKPITPQQWSAHCDAAYERARGGRGGGADHTTAMAYAQNQTAKAFGARPPEIMMGVDPAVPDTVITAARLDGVSTGGGLAFTGFPGQATRELIERNRQRALAEDEFPGRGDGE